MAAWRYEISLLMLKRYFTHSLRSLEEEFRISARSCNILYFCNCIEVHVEKVSVIIST